MGLLSLEGTLVESPGACCEAPSFPAATTSIPFALNACPKNAAVSTGAKTRNVQTAPATFVALSGVGANDDVKQADIIYVRVKSPGFQLRVTYNNPAGSPIVSVVPLAGILVLEPDAASGYYATLLEITGNGQVEYFASGAQ